MKTILKYSLALLASGAMFTSCLGDLDTQPLSENISTADQAFASPESYSRYANYAYAYFSFVSQGDPGSSDIAVDNAGQSEYIRQYMDLNEMAADSFKVCDAWTDDYVKPLQYGKWNGTNAAVVAVYQRGLKAVAMCNEFLSEAVSGDAAVIGRGHEAVLDDVRAYRSELRLLRALHYEILMDLFGNPPMVSAEGMAAGALPTQLGRTELFKWIESELLALTEDEFLADKPFAYPRLSKGAAWAILARMYLNAEVYTGTARWEDAKKAAEKVINEGGYELCPDYKYLFLQDNSTNGAQKEFIIAAMYDKEKTQSYGGTTHLMLGAVNENMATKEVHLLFGLENPIYNGQWNGYHVSNEFVMENFNLQGVVWGGSEVAWGYDVERSDYRAAFYNYGFTPEFVNESSDITTGWACLKWVPLDSNKKSTMVVENPAGGDPLTYAFSSADFPIFRLAEMYLIAAEAEARMKGGVLSKGDAGYGYLETIYKRANGEDAELDFEIDLDWILKERVRELMWEGHRRVDLNRYGLFLTAEYPWPYKNGIKSGVSAIESHRSIYPIITSDMITNGQLKQNPGYPER